VGAHAGDTGSTTPQTLSADAEDVEILELATLPDGIMFVNQSVSVQPGFPSDPDPHVLIGSYPIGGSGEQLNIQAKNKAAENGGNAVFIDRVRDLAYVFKLSKTTPDYPKARALFSELEATHTNRRYRKLAEKKRTLEKFESVKISLKPAHCYAIGVVLDEDASLTSVARRGLVVSMVDPTGDQKFQLPVRRAEQYTFIRDYFLGIACAAKGRSVSIDLYAGPSKAPAGQGTVVVRVYELRLTGNDRKRNCSDLNDYLQPLARSEGLCL